MQHRVLAIAVALFAAPVVSNKGKAWVHNHCDFPVHLWSVDAHGTSEPVVLETGDKYNETLRRLDIGGVSIKLSSSEQCTDITQLEYTVTDMLWYDISNVNCEGDSCPFSSHGMYMESGEGCPTRTCSPMEMPCKGAYTVYNDDWNSLACEGPSDLILHLCRDAPPSDKESKRAAPTEEFGVPAHRRKMRRHTHGHGHPHWRR